MDNFCTLVTAKDRGRILKWLTDNTSINWVSGDRPWPCSDLDNSADTLLIIANSGLAARYSRGLVARWPFLNSDIDTIPPLDFCNKAKHEFPIEKDLKLKPKKERTEQKEKQGELCLKK